MEDVGGHELDGGTRLEVEIGRILVCFSKQPLDENRFGHLEQAEKLKRHIQKKH